MAQEVAEIEGEGDRRSYIIHCDRPTCYTPHTVPSATTAWPHVGAACTVARAGSCCEWSTAPSANTAWPHVDAACAVASVGGVDWAWSDCGSILFLCTDPPSQSNPRPMYPKGSSSLRSSCGVVIVCAVGSELAPVCGSACTNTGGSTAAAFRNVAVDWRRSAGAGGMIGAANVPLRNSSGTRPLSAPLPAAGGVP